MAIKIFGITIGKKKSTSFIQPTSTNSLGTSSSKLADFKSAAGVGQTGIPGTTITPSGTISHSGGGSSGGGGGGSSPPPSQPIPSAKIADFKSAAGVGQTGIPKTTETSSISRYSIPKGATGIVPTGSTINYGSTNFIPRKETGRETIVTFGTATQPTISESEFLRGQAINKIGFAGGTMQTQKGSSENLSFLFIGKFEMPKERDFQKQYYNIVSGSPIDKQTKDFSFDFNTRIEKRTYGSQGGVPDVSFVLVEPLATPTGKETFLTETEFRKYVPLTLTAGGGGVEATEYAETAVRTGYRPETNILGDISTGLSRKKDIFGTSSAQGSVSLGNIGGQFAVGLGTSVIGGLTFGKEFITSPVSTTKAFGKSFIGLPSQFGKLGGILKYEAPFAAGYVAGEYFQFKGGQLIQKSFIKGFDIGRTWGLDEIPAERVIAPEYFKGQRYPSIKRGQTAGSLLSEFKPMTELGEIKPAGFTAAPRPFKSITTAKAGGSEFLGVYQAPKLSATFLSVSGETKKLFTFNPFGETLRPTALRITPTAFELAPGVKYTSGVSGARLGKLKGFFAETAERGKSYIPFIKTEKEAIIPVGTEFVQTGRKAFFKFEGRRIPIQEFKTISRGKITGNKVYSLGDISKISSSSRVGRRGLFSSSDIGLFFSSSLYKLTPSSYSVLPSSSSSRLLKGSNSALKSSGKSFSSKSFLKGSYGSLLFSSGSFGGGGSSSGLVISGDIFPPGKKIVFKPIQFGIPQKQKILRQERKFKRTPSYLGLYGKGLGIKIPKFSLELEKTGLVSRAYIGNVNLGNLGPFPIKTKKRRSKK